MAEQREADIDQPEAGEVARADFLVRSALDFVTKAYPIADVQVSYQKRDEGEQQTDGSEIRASAVELDAFDTCQDVRPVPGRPDYLRVLDITLNEQMGRFLGRGAGGEYLDHACERIDLALDLADTWTGRIGSADHRDTRDVFKSALPPRLVARLAAEHLVQMQEVDRGQREHVPGADGLREDGIEELSTILAQSLEYMDDLARSRVEHQELSHGIVVAPRAEEDRTEASSQRRYPRDYRRLKRTPLLSNGYQTALRIAPNGQPMELLMRPDLLTDLEAPPHEFGEFTFLAAASRKYGGIGLMLMPGGSIVMFVVGRPLFIRRSGQWRGMIWDVIRNVMVERYGDVGTHVFEAALLLTTSGRGGILAVMDEDAPVALNDKDRVDRARAGVRYEGEHPAEPDEWLFHDLLPEAGVTEISPPSLALLASIDGATLVARDGTLLAYGAIVPSRQSESEGARTAAARTLSSGGFVLKISEDGPIQLFEDGKLVLTI